MGRDRFEYVITLQDAIKSGEITLCKALDLLDEFDDKN
jgi:hypothetical protein